MGFCDSSRAARTSEPKPEAIGYGRRHRKAARIRTGRERKAATWRRRVPARSDKAEQPMVLDRLDAGGEIEVVRIARWRCRRRTAAPTTRRSVARAVWVIELAEEIPCHRVECADCALAEIADQQIIAEFAEIAGARARPQGEFRLLQRRNAAENYHWCQTHRQSHGPVQQRHLRHRHLAKRR